MPGHLNIFQRAMLQWNELQPYNAVHVVRFALPLEMDRLRRVIEGSLAQRGIGHLTLDRRRGTYQYRPAGVPIEIRGADEIGAGGGGTACVAQLEHELNTPFRIDRPFCPVRFFVLPERDAFSLGAAYFHAAADAESMILLLRGIVAGYAGAGEAYPTPPFDCHPRRHDRWWQYRPGLFMRKLAAIPFELRTMRRAVRLHLRDADDLRNRVRLMRVGSGTLEALLVTAKGWGVTVHDLLLALLLRALAPLAPRRGAKARRRNIALGSIVNVRGECGIDRERTFGLYLGSFVVSHAVPEGVDLRALATDLRGQTGRIKRRKLYLATPLELAFAGRVFNLCSTRRRKQFYHKHHPLAGGISNMSLDPYWQPGNTARPADYFRAVSTGPATPLVLSATTYNRGMTCALSCRAGVFTPAGMDEFQARFDAELKRLEGGA
ncbi:MAG: hypothetical protein KJ072_01605 [Verrucomicrobia bacterium]|nr:hypothetical protein [Verrucomicrobiota bacterium]